MRDVEPEFWCNLRGELLAGRQWIDRGVVLAYAAATGLVVVGFTFLAEAAAHAFSQLEQAGTQGRYLALLWTPLLTVAVLWWTRRHVPGALGSGIPQVVRTLDDELDASQRAWLVSLRVSLHKIGLVSGGLLAGLSIGREGPTVQVGAGVMVNAQRWLSPQSGIDAHDLMVAARRPAMRRPSTPVGRHRLCPRTTVPAAQHVAQLIGDRQQSPASCWPVWWRWPCSAMKPTSVGCAFRSCRGRCCGRG